MGYRKLELYSGWIFIVSSLLISRSSCGTIYSWTADEDDIRSWTFLERKITDKPPGNQRNYQKSTALPPGNQTYYIKSTEPSPKKQTNYPKSTKPPPKEQTGYPKSTKPPPKKQTNYPKGTEPSPKEQTNYPKSTKPPTKKQTNYPKITKPPPKDPTNYPKITEPEPPKKETKSLEPAILGIVIPIIIIVILSYVYKTVMCLRKPVNNTTSIHESATQASHFSSVESAAQTEPNMQLMEERISNTRELIANWTPFFERPYSNINPPLRQTPILSSYSSIAATAPRMELMEHGNINATAPVTDWLSYFDRPNSTTIELPSRQVPIISPFSSVIPTAPSAQLMENGNNTSSALSAGRISSSDKPPPYIEVVLDSKKKQSKFPKVQSTTNYELPPPKYDEKLVHNKL